MYDLICFGNLTIDDIVFPDGQTQMACFGDDAIYASLAASLWSEKVQFVAPVGGDFPQEHLKHLNQSGWDISGMTHRSVSSIQNWIVYEYDGRRTWIPRHDEGDFFVLSPSPGDIPQDFKNSKAFLILAMDLAAQEHLVPYLKGLGGTVALDPQEDYIAGNHDKIFHMIAGVDIFMPSQVEVERLLGHKDYERGAREFGQCGCQVVVVKMGSQGSLIYNREQDLLLQVPAYQTKMIDTTGAGDSFCGGFMAMYLRSGDLLRSGLAGAISASFAIEGFGLAHMFSTDKDKAQKRFDRLAKQVGLD